MAKESPVILVDDREEDILLARMAFQRAGVRRPLIALRQGAKARDYLCGEGDFADRALFPWPALVLLDLKMPGLDGFDVLKDWHQQAARFVPIIVVSSSGQGSDIKRSRQLGAVGYFIKPMDLTDFVRFIEALKATWLRADSTANSAENPEHTFVLYD